MGKDGVTQAALLRALAANNPIEPGKTIAATSLRAFVEKNARRRWTGT